MLGRAVTFYRIEIQYHDFIFKVNLKGFWKLAEAGVKLIVEPVKLLRISLFDISIRYPLFARNRLPVENVWFLAQP